MSIPAIGSAPIMPSSGMERAEGTGPDVDGDADDTGAQSPIQAAPAPGTGQTSDKTA